MESELFVKGLSEWASSAGDLLQGVRSAVPGEIRVRVTQSDQPATSSAKPAGWNYLWRLGDGTIYFAVDDEIRILTQSDVGILQTEVDHTITPSTRLEWSWKVDKLPSRLAEDLQFTHDYLSVAVEFEDGKDLTYMWSAGLARKHIFTCPLNFWCDRETHWVVRTPHDGLGVWHSENRSLWSDTERAYGRHPRKAVRLWLIANSVFQRNEGSASIRDLKLVEAE
jgi:hypothetical protein